MSLIFERFQENLKNNTIKIKNKKLNNVIKSYCYYNFTEKIDIDQNQNIFKNIKESDAIIINEYLDMNNNEKYFIISFKNSLIFIQQSSIIYFQSFFAKNQQLPIYFLSETKNDFNKRVTIRNSQFEPDDKFILEISNFIYDSIYKSNSKSLIYQIFQSIAGYLIKHSYNKINKNQKYIFSNKKANTSYLNDCEIDDFVTLRQLGIGSSFVAELVYHIEKEELFVIKKPCCYSSENEKLIKRESENYLKINYPLLPKFYGKVKNEDYIIIQFINGETLSNIKDLNFQYREKVSIIFEMMLILNYLHKNNFVYRDLKPNNVIVDEFRNVFFIDFDRKIR